MLAIGQGPVFLRGLNSQDRLTRPLLRRGGELVETDWQTALEYAAAELVRVRDQYGADAIGALVSPHSTLEELHLAQKLIRGLGSDNIDFRLRQSDFSADPAAAGAPWLGMSIEEVGKLERALVVGSFLRKDHPLLAHRLRQAATKGAQISSLHSVDDDWLIKLAHRAIVTPSLLPSILAQIVVAAAQGAGKPPPGALQGIEPVAAADVIAVWIDWQLQYGARGDGFTCHCSLAVPVAAVWRPKS